MASPVSNYLSRTSCTSAPPAISSWLRKCGLTAEISKRRSTSGLATLKDKLVIMRAVGRIIERMSWVTVRGVASARRGSIASAQRSTRRMNHTEYRSAPPMSAFLNGKLPPAAILQTGNWAVVEAFPKLEFDDPTELVPERGVIVCM